MTERLLKATYNTNHNFFQVKSRRQGRVYWTCAVRVCGAKAATNDHIHLFDQTDLDVPRLIRWTSGKGAERSWPQFRQSMRKKLPRLGTGQNNLRDKCQLTSRDNSLFVRKWQRKKYCISRSLQIWHRRPCLFMSIKSDPEMQYCVRCHLYHLHIHGFFLRVLTDRQLVVNRKHP